MAKPSYKSTEINEMVDNIGIKAFGRDRTTSIKNDFCIMCGNSATKFRDILSKKEYSISGMCQTCQDSIWEEGL